jgi:hypothetical protein
MSTSLGSSGSGAERVPNEQEEKRRRSKLEGIRRQVRSGKLVVRQMTDEERAKADKQA